MSEFAKRVIHLFEQVHPLDRVPRAGYLLRGVPEPESVSAHSHFLSLLALVFVEEHPGRFNLERVLSMATVHDLSEARIMDIPMPYADAYLADAKQNAEQMIINELFEGFPRKLAVLHHEFEAGQSLEARLLRGLDKVQMMLKILGYERERRGYLEEFWINAKNFRDYGIAEVSELFDAICAHAGRVRPREREAAQAPYPPADAPGEEG